MPAALELYRNPGTNVEAGLLRRRKAEGKCWGSHRPQYQQETAKLSIDAPFTARLTPHVTLGEFALNQEARRFDRADQLEVAAYIAAFLERVRVAFGGKPIILTSGYRPPAVNSAVGGASNSEHLYKPGCGAVDFYIDGADVHAVQAWCDKNWPHSVGYGAAKGFVHLGLRDSGTDPKTAPRIRWDY